MGIQTQESEAKGKVAPKAKERQDEAIIGTNDYSIVSKRSVEKFYYKDEPQFLRAFVHKFKRRAPLVNRGYWLRMRAIEAVVGRFLDEDTGKSKAVVNLGCGYEPLAFRMLWKYPVQCHDMKFVDVDFPQLIEKKVRMIRNESTLNERLDSDEDEDATHPSIRYSNREYCAVACDLGDRMLLEHVLKDHLNLDSRSILFISEVAIVYMPPDEATNVISFCSTFADARFCLLEQCLPADPDHPFARTMNDHFRRTPLRGLSSFPSIESQRSRFRKLGWHGVQIADLWTMWQNQGFINDLERRSLDAVELFDEWEGLALWAGHNFLLLAATKAVQANCTSWFQLLIPSRSDFELSPRPSTKISFDALSLPRNRDRVNGTILPQGEYALIHCGGTTIDPLQGIGDVYTHTKNVIEHLPMPPVKLSFATISETGRKSALPVGGRASPSRASSSCYSYKDGTWHQEANIVPARYRHCAASVSVDQDIGVLVFGGKTGSGEVLSSWSLFSNQQWHEVEATGDRLDRPPPLFGAAMAATGPAKGILVGGLDQNGRLRHDARPAGFWRWALQTESGRCPAVHVKYIPAMEPQTSVSKSLLRFGATTINTPSGVLIVGGIGPQGPLQRIEELVLLKHDGTVLTCEPVLRSTEALPMFIGHSVLSISDEEVIMVGGGTVCFSYGAFWNSSISRLTIGDAKIDSNGSWKLLSDSSKANTTERNLTRNHDHGMNGSAISKGTPEAQVSGPARSPHSTQITRLKDVTAVKEQIHRTTSTPFVIEGLELGPCTQLWTKSYLKTQVGPDKPTIIHSANSPNLLFHAKNFSYDTVNFSSFLDAASTGSHVYMRALSATKPSRTPTSLASDYPLLSPDFIIPEALNFAREHQHSSVLRISGNVNMWLHYDVMSNILCQVTGSKRVILFPPKDVSLLDFPPGETTSSLGVFRSESERFSECSPVETTLKAGEVLFIPACWPHATAPANNEDGPSVAVNVFFKSLDDKLYAAGRDVYGNRDLEMYQNGRNHVAKIRKLLGEEAEQIGARGKEKIAVLAATLKAKSWANDHELGGTEVNRIVASSRDLPRDLAQFYLARLADELVGYSSR